MSHQLIKKYRKDFDIFNQIYLQYTQFFNQLQSTSLLHMP